MYSISMAAVYVFRGPFNILKHIYNFIELLNFLKLHSFLFIVDDLRLVCIAYQFMCVTPPSLNYVKNIYISHFPLHVESASSNNPNICPLSIFFISHDNFRYIINQIYM